MIATVNSYPQNFENLLAFREAAGGKPAKRLILLDLVSVPVFHRRHTQHLVFTNTA